MFLCFRCYILKPHLPPPHTRSLYRVSQFHLVTSLSWLSVRITFRTRLLADLSMKLFITEGTKAKPLDTAVHKVWMGAFLHPIPYWQPQMGYEEEARVDLPKFAVKYSPDIQLCNFQSRPAGKFLHPVQRHSQLSKRTQKRRCGRCENCRP